MKLTYRHFSFLPLACIVLLITVPALSANQPSNHQNLLRQEGQYLSILEKTPDATETRIQLAQLYLKKNRYSKAADHFQMALALGSTNAALYRDLSFCQLRMGAIEDAIQTCKEGIAANPQNSELHLRLGNLYHKQGMDREAEEEYALSHQVATD